MGGAGFVFSIAALIVLSGVLLACALLKLTQVEEKNRKDTNRSWVCYSSDILRHIHFATHSHKQHKLHCAYLLK